MSSGPRHKDTGATMTEVIANIPRELPYDAVGVWQIVPLGEVGFGLNGQALSNFLRDAILALLEAGAVPVKHIAGSGYEWVHQKHYGQTREEIADAVVREWEPVTHDSASMIEYCPWFARPDPKFPLYVKLN